MLGPKLPVAFVRPPEAPVYYPTEEEFTSPLQYIQSIKPEAEKYGICKIVPPKSFKPHFAVNKETFKFKARYQRLSDLDGFSRSRHSFACMLRRFWTDQGWPADLPVPSIGDKYIDWYDLYIEVHRLGGHRALCATPDGWSTLARQLGFSTTSHSVPKELRAIYEKNLLPYDEFRASVEIYLGKDRDNSRSAPVNKSAGCRRMKKDPACSATPATDDTKEEDRHDSTASCVGGVLQETDSPNKEDTRKMRVRRNQSNVCYSEVVCEVCKETDEFDNLKFCEKCETTYHLRCIPASIRKDKAKLWLCPKCMKETYDGLRACHTFGFEHTNTLYTLDQFQRNANDFKRKYFNALNVGLHVVEEEFWRLLADSNDETVVEYGADLHRGEQGSSGFPTETDRSTLRESEREYIDHPWNLNKLPDNELSILKHITVQISGMKIPWMYVGMVFSAFCWHTEDHWSASINFVHLGEPKTWYGVPGASADAFETAFKQLVPILMESNPDLLHQLVTHMNPTVLQSCGIPVYRVDQRAGEFIVTFPRAYHAGFNQGFNFAEAVNFCLADWIPHGRLSIGHYSNCKRDLVFSHDELICCMADQASHLHPSIAKSCHADFLHMVDEESSHRQHLIELGIIVEDEPTLFEFMDDHERACASCHTTLFLSAVQCGCSNERLACARHAAQICSCDMTNKRLLYRYTIDDLGVLLHRLLKQAEVTDVDGCKPIGAAGATTTHKRIAHGGETKVPVKRQKVAASLESGPMDFFGELDGTAVSNSELKAVMKMASELVSPSTITRTRESNDTPSVQKRWKVSDAESLITSLLAFPGTGKEAALVREYLRKYYALQGEIRSILQIRPEDQMAEVVRRVYDQTRSTNIESDDVLELQKIVQQTEFRERIIGALNDPRTKIQQLAEVLQTADEIFVRSEYMENMVALLTNLIDEGRNLEIDAENVTRHGKTITLEDAKKLVERADAYPIDLEHIDDIRDGIETIEKLITLLEECKVTGQRLHYQKVKSILEGEDLSIFKDHCATELLKMADRASQFIDKLRQLFFGCATSVGPAAGQNVRLLEILCPRKARQKMVAVPPLTARGGQKKKSAEENGQSSSPPESQPGLDGKVHPFDLNLDNQFNFDDLRILFERACVNEQTQFERIREGNCLKSAIDNDLREDCAALRRDLRWCNCGQQSGVQALSDSLVQCDSCFEWFHVSCTRMAEFIYADGIAEFGLVKQLVESIQFMCDYCQRGVRPPLELLIQLLKEYTDVQKYFCVPEMDLLNLVIARAEKWRRSATNIVLALPDMVQLFNRHCLSNRVIADSIRYRLRDTLLAILLEGNLLEIKVPEWMFLYDFVHENFRKDRSDEGRHVGPMILPLRSGRLPLAVDAIAPLFKELTKGVRIRADSGTTMEAPPAVESRAAPADMLARPSPVRRGRGPAKIIATKPLPPDIETYTVADSSSPGKRSRRRITVMVVQPEPVVVRSRQRTVSTRSSAAETSSLENSHSTTGEDASETCSSCHAVLSPDSLLSIVDHGQIVPICSACTTTRNLRLRRQKSASQAASDAESPNTKLRSGPKRRTRAGAL